ncbi:MAG: Flp pilus assembly complex ATPase component TadA [Clostridia bacterium]|nr:Flp pilus assembly complex ATPase component TadA [Clostridia bacterium]
MKKIEQLRKYLPQDVYRFVKEFENSLTEIRIRRGKPLSLTLARGECGPYGYGENYICPLVIHDDLMDRIISSLCHHSLYSHMESMTDGYIAMKEGVRVGVSGKAVCDNVGIKNLSSVNSLNIRIPRFIYNISIEIYTYLAQKHFGESILIFSPPNMGKTTVLRDLIRQLALGAPPRRVAVVDTRCEIEVEELHEVCHIDFLSGYPRGKGIEIATRTLSPQYIICDEIGGYEEVRSLLSAQNAGVPVIATAHASTAEELLQRDNIRILNEHNLFSEYVGIQGIRIGSAPILSFTSAREISDNHNKK